MAEKSYTYETAGVSIAAGNALVKAIGPLVKATARPGADAEIGGFGGLFAPHSATTIRRLPRLDAHNRSCCPPCDISPSCAAKMCAVQIPSERLPNRLRVTTITVQNGASRR